MLALLGTFKFEIKDTAYQRLSEKIEYEWAEHKRALSFVGHENVGAYKQSFDIQGTLILKNAYSLEELKTLASFKKPLPLVFGTGFCYWVIIENIEIDHSRFIPSGGAIKRDFRVSLRRYCKLRKTHHPSFNNPSICLHLGK